MPSLSLKSLVAKLDEHSRRALEAAAGACLSRTNHQVEAEHWLVKLLEIEGGDLRCVLRHFEIDVDRVLDELNTTLDRFRTGNDRTPSIASGTVELMRQAWLLASVEFGANRARSVHVLCAFLERSELDLIGRQVPAALRDIPVGVLRSTFADIVAESIETTRASSSSTGPGRACADDAASPRTGSGGSLDQFTLDLTAAAHRGEIDPVIGRDAEIRQMVDILTRRRQNNPILTGEAGVGKTAVVEGFARRVAAGDVPEALRGVSVRTLDLGLLQAGAGIKGEFENRLKSVIEEIAASVQPVILFIDEAHTLIGAGAQPGQGDAANLLKPALARGELRTIAATTWAEYKKYFEKDAALTRRFQVVKVDEPDEETATRMMRGLVATLEDHHGVRILDEAVGAAVRQTQRYLPGRQLPDKAISVLDTACARVALSHSTTPAAIEERERRLEALAVSKTLLEREVNAGADHGDRLAELIETSSVTASELECLRERWEQERGLVRDITALREQLSGDAKPERDAAVHANGTTSRGSEREQLGRLNDTLRRLQGEAPLVRDQVDAEVIAEVLAAWTGIPVGRMLTDEIDAVLQLRERMENRIVGQPHALEAIARGIRTARANLADPRRPLGVFLLVGPSGVGKTETALTLGELLFGDARSVTVINMSEFKEEHKVSLLTGSPPGYVGYGEGGVLTEAVRRRPYGVVLLDEMEKAHPGVQEIFYQVFDRGTLRDGEGRDVDFRNTVIVMASNAASDRIASECANTSTLPEPDALTDQIRPTLLRTFRPAFLGRVTLVPFHSLSDESMRHIVELQLDRVQERISAHYGAAFSYDDELVSAIVQRCREVDTGARNVDHILSQRLLPELSAELLGRLAAKQTVSAVHVSVAGGSTFRYDIDTNESHRDQGDHHACVHEAR